MVVVEGEQRKNVRVAQSSTESEIRGQSAHTDNCYILRN